MVEDDDEEAGNCDDREGIELVYIESSSSTQFCIYGH
jgi:hypothetical protein